MNERWREGRKAGGEEEGQPARLALPPPCGAHLCAWPSRPQAGSHRCPTTPGHGLAFGWMDKKVGGSQQLLLCEKMSCCFSSHFFKVIMFAFSCIIIIGNVHCAESGNHKKNKEENENRPYSHHLETEATAFGGSIFPNPFWGGG